MVHAIAVATWRVVNPSADASGFTRSAKCLPACTKTSASCMLQPVVNKLVSQSGSATGQRRTGLLVMFFRTMGENVAEGMREVSIVTSMCLQYATVSLDELQPRLDSDLRLSCEVVNERIIANALIEHGTHRTWPDSRRSVLVAATWWRSSTTRVGRFPQSAVHATIRRAISNFNNVRAAEFQFVGSISIPITMTTTIPQLQLRSIFDLLKDRFIVPSYQRGYRWEARQVEALLDDLAAFQLSTRQSSPNTFYCLQPIVVRRRLERNGNSSTDSSD